MKACYLLFVGLILLCATCDDADDNAPVGTPCPISNSVKSKETAKALIAGKWNWRQTTFTRRGSGISEQIADESHRTMTFEFLDDQLKILDNGVQMEQKYEIIYWGEGTNTVDEQLAIRFINSSGEYLGTSLLFLSSSGTCLTLCNSYNDAGGDLNFQRAD